MQGNFLGEGLKQVVSDEQCYGRCKGLGEGKGNDGRQKSMN